MSHWEPDVDSDPLLQTTRHRLNWRSRLLRLIRDLMVRITKALASEEGQILRDAETPKVRSILSQHSVYLSARNGVFLKFLHDYSIDPVAVST
jgi:hypothetical protein